jgi:glucose-6-phosphate 1-dehydrogenase
MEMTYDRPLSDALVLFGVTGDLAHKMIFPALYSMVKHGALKLIFYTVLAEVVHSR